MRCPHWALLLVVAGGMMVLTSCGPSEIKEDVSPEAEAVLSQQADMIEQIGRQQQESAEKMRQQMLGAAPPQQPR